jgi:DNA modification methylase
MIADELATQLAERYVSAGDAVLDPFCGTARTLIAAEAAGASELTGVDVNPLATLIARAKFASVSSAALRRMLLATPSVGDRQLQFERRKVSWFSARARRDLTSIVDKVNGATWLKAGERTLIAAVLSATARHVSYCRNDQWKLHRVSRSRRRRRVDAHAVFRRRLEAVIAEIDSHSNQKRVRARFLQARCGGLRAALSRSRAPSQFDVVITSPPYGDSFSTVQYGGISSICLDVIRHIKGLSFPYRGGNEIDSRCLGSSRIDVTTTRAAPYWPGGVANPRRLSVKRFLADMENACVQMSAIIKPRGRAIFVVGRRRTGGFRLKLDKFITDVLQREGFALEDIWERPIRSKRLPSLINRFGGARAPARGVVATMRREFIVVLRRH